MKYLALVLGLITGGWLFYLGMTTDNDNAFFASGVLLLSSAFIGYMISLEKRNNKGNGELTHVEKDKLIYDLIGRLRDEDQDGTLFICAMFHRQYPQSGETEVMIGIFPELYDYIYQVGQDINPDWKWGDCWGMSLVGKASNYKKAGLLIDFRESNKY